MKIPITQSKKWQEFQEALNEKSFLVEEDGFEYLAILKTTPVGNYLYLPYGPVAEDKRSFKKALSSLEKLAAENNAIFTRVEPQRHEFVSSMPSTAKKSKDLNPAHTLIIDLTRTREEILADVPRRTRGYFNTYTKKGLKVVETKEPNDIKHLVELQKTLAKDKGIGVFSEDYLKKQLEQPFASLYLVKYNPTFEEEHPDEKKEIVIAAVLVFDDEDTRYYIQAAQDKVYTKLAAPSIVVCQMLMDAKEKGLKFFDFWGIAPEDAPDSHPWKGFTKFKQSFGGTPVEYAGTYDIIYNKSKYRLYQLTRKINRLIRKV
jgi:lipid II:glycine glycyltransferase (peptidoglycan interpeptide bridge formation enzyme)